MSKKVLGLVGGAIAAGLPFLALADYTVSPFTVPSSTAQSFLAQVSSQLGDVGLLTVAIVAVAIPLTFYIIHQLMGLVPKSRGGRRT
jgi:hypothetical protein